MHIHWLQHVPFEGLGYIESWMKNRQIVPSVTRFYTEDTLPAIESIHGLVVMGGPMGVHDVAEFPWLKQEKDFIRSVIDSHKPVVGICLGAQLIADVLGAQVTPGQHKEIGWFGITKTNDARHPVAELLPNDETVFHWHGDQFQIPENAIRLYESNVCPNQAFIYKDNVLGLQFHMETLPENIDALIENCRNELVLAEYIQTAEQMRANTRYCQAMNSTLETILDFVFAT